MCATLEVQRSADTIVAYTPAFAATKNHKTGKEPITHYLATGIVLAGLILSPVFAIAQEAATFSVAESAEHRRYLTDAQGPALYLFEADTKGEGDVAKVSCLPLPES